MLFTVKLVQQTLKYENPHKLERLCRDHPAKPSSRRALARAMPWPVVGGKQRGSIQHKEARSITQAHTGGF
jgi:hypothetical protein